MAIRNIREFGDPILNKPCKEVTEMTPRTRQLIEDMLDTMYEEGGVGLAAPQVGILKRIVVIDISEEGNEPHILINPRIIESSGEQKGNEGCLSLPGKAGVVPRPNYIKCVAQDVELREFELEGEELLARAICHELDHLEGHLFTEFMEGELMDAEQLEAQENEETAKKRKKRRIR